jgi:hypothetical protein
MNAEGVGHVEKYLDELYKHLREIRRETIEQLGRKKR